MISTSVPGCVYRMALPTTFSIARRSCSPCAPSRGISPRSRRYGTALGLDLEVSIDGNFLNQAVGSQVKRDSRLLR
jgi:hypothetical protein